MVAQAGLEFRFIGPSPMHRHRLVVPCAALQSSGSRGASRGDLGHLAPCGLGRGGKAWPQPAPTLSLFPWQIHSDSDEGDGSIKYTISGEGAGTIFLIDEITGDIHATERLDREQKTFYTLRAQARDRQTDQLLEPESEFIIKVQDINDSEPRFLEGPYIGSVAELSPVGRSGWEAVGWGTCVPLLSNLEPAVPCKTTCKPQGFQRGPELGSQKGKIKWLKENK